MISVMMSNNSNNVLEAGRRIDSEQDAAAGYPSRVSVNDVGGDDETRSSNSKSLSIEKVEDSIGFVEARVSNDCSSNNNNDNSDVSLVLDLKGSAEARVSEGVKERTDICVTEIKRDAEKSNVNQQKSCSGKREMEGKGEEKSKVVESQNGKTECKKSNLSDYNSMLSMFDEFAQSGNRWAVGYGYEIGDMVWGKVKSHPWWPGHIYNEAFASPSVRRIKTEGHVLVAFFGDSSYGWFDPAELIPFEPNFVEKSKQMNSRSFMKAVEEAIDEVSRRSGLGLACRCRNPYNFRPTRVEGFFSVDVGDYEPGEIFSASQIKRARDSFQPQEMLAFVKQLALKPRSSDYENINFIKRKASVLMYRKAVFEEFDETYAQAFGAQPVRPEPKTAADLSREPSRAPLSGPLVVAEALGKGKASGKSAKAKDQVEKDRYLFKRRDESNQLKAQKATQGQPGHSSKPIQIDGRVSGKGTYMSMDDQVPRTIGSNVAEVFGQPSDHSVPVEARGHGENHRTAGDPKLHAEGSKKQTEVGPKKVKVHKRPAGEMSSKDSGSVEKKKKRKKEFGMQMSSESTQVPTVAGKVGASVVKVAEKLVQITPSAEVEMKMDNQGNDLVGKLVQVPSAVGGDLKMENQKKDDQARAPVLPPQQTVDGSNTGFELGQLLTDLRALALNPFHGVERSCPLMLQKVFLKFRSLVYQKSLVSLEPNETESSEAHAGRSLAIAAVSDDARVERVKEMSVKPQKPSSRLEDPTLGGRKRGPSDRQEEMAAKKKKKVSDLKSLAAEKRAAQKATEAPRADTKEMAVKSAVPTSKAVRPEAVKKTEVVVKETDPTMLIMKFPPGGALPSHAELKAKFARFGPLDPNKIRVYWQSSQCRLVYQHKSHAQAALKFATGSNSPFGNASVRCYLRDLSVEMPELESAKVLKKEDSSVGASQFREPVVEQRQAAKLASQLLQPPVQLKSCLKRPSGEEGSSVNGGNGGGVRGARVKFMLGGEESSKSEHVTVGNRNSDNNASFADGGASSSSSHATTTMEFSSKNFHRIIPPSSQLSSSAFPLPTAQLPKPPPNNMHYNEAVSRNLVDFNTPPAPPPMPGMANIDIAQQMLSLLTKCNDVVTNLTGLLGYAPYHPL